ncbi:extracellular solute-binding protein [Candidatus Uhrbacteria bacterium]|nr:extracellular solute-binding protein [Candidatus Uhrbacteria bacterium]
MDVIARSTGDEAIPVITHKRRDCFGVWPRNDRRWWFGVLLVLPLLFLGLSCTKGIPKNVTDRLKQVRLEWWGVNETEEEVLPIITEYQKLHKNVSVTYRRFRYPEYEARLLDALSEKDFQGPDIFAIPSTWSRKYQSKLLPAPLAVTMPFTEMRGTVKKELFAELRETRLTAPSEIPNVFVDAVAPDAVLATEPTERAPSQPAMFGLPLSVDTLVLYGNRDLLNAAGIPEPAKTWTEFQTHVPRLTKVGANGELLQAGAAIGTSGNVQRSFDILSLLMMQNGAVMSGPDGEPRFHQIPQALSGARQSPPSADALLYYVDFANPQKLVYTWNDDQPDSLEAFLTGRVAYFFGYSYHLPIIKARAPRINVSVTGVPHMAAAVDPTTGIVVGSDLVGDGVGTVAVNVANFWLEVVSERTKYVNEAWDFVHTVTTRPAIVRPFLEASGRPTALRGLIGEDLQQPTRKVFAAQLLTARSWYHGSNPDAVEQAFAELIEAARTGTTDVRRALQVAAEKVAQTL